MRAALAIELSEPGADAERLEQLTTQLRSELLELDVDQVTRPRIGEAPPGSRSPEAIAAVGALLVTMNASGDLLGNVIRAVRAWIARSPQPCRKVSVRLGDTSIELDCASSSTQEDLVAEVLRAMQRGERPPASADGG